MIMFEFHVICEKLNLDERTLQQWIDRRLVLPADLSGPYFDEEDFSRIRLIAEMKQLYDTNDESLEVFLHLIDQIHHLSAELKNLKRSDETEHDRSR